MKRKNKKIKKDKLPKDTLGIYQLESGAFDKIANVKSYKVPEKWSGYVAYMLEDIKEKKTAKKEEENPSSFVTKKKKKKNTLASSFVVVFNIVPTDEWLFLIVRGQPKKKKTKKSSSFPNCQYLEKK